MNENLAPIPDLSVEYQKYMELNPAFDPANPDERAVADVNSIFYKKEKPHTHKEIAENLRLFQIAIRVKIQQLDENKIWDIKGGTTDEEFKRFMRTVSKNAQEVLVHPTERMDTDTINDLIIDPQYITDTLLKNLGLREFISKKPGRRSKAIPKIREVLKNMEPITQGSRLMTIARGKNHGLIIGTQETNTHHKAFYMADLATAIRKLGKIIVRYHKELRRGPTKERREAIRRISRYYNEDLGTIERLVRAQEEPIRSFLSNVELSSDRLRILQTDRSLTDEEKKHIKKSLNSTEAQLKKQRFEPYLSFGRKMRGQIKTTGSGIDTAKSPEEREQTAKEFIKIYLIAKLTRCYWQLQGICRDVSGTTTPTIDSMSAKVQSIAEQFENKKVGSGLRIPDYGREYGKMRHLLESLKKIMEEGDGEDKETLKKAKDAIKKFKFLALARSLP